MKPELPPIFILPANLQSSELHSLEEKVGSLTWDVTEAEVIVGKITRRERALFELRKLRVNTEEIPTDKDTRAAAHQPQPQEPLSKRRRIADGDDAEVDDDNAETKGGREGGSTTVHGTVKVVRLEWLTQSLLEGVALPFGDYLLYQGRRKGDINGTTSSPATRTGSTTTTSTGPTSIGGHRPHTYGSSPSRSHPQQPRPPSLDSKRPALLHETTSEHDIPLPPVPDFLHTTYSCQRPTPVHTPNAGFVDALKEVRTLRLLEGDQIGVRAYSTSIAALAAYPHPVHSSFEVSRLPGCGAKIAQLWQQWKETGRLIEVAEAEMNERLSILKLFYDIWGVGDTTARDFYAKGWRDLDDLIEFGWSTLSRVQQIGVKYYDEFQLKIPRHEVCHIADTILSHCRKMHEGFQMTIVGGYRRGKEYSGDVDVVVSHPDEAQTLHVVQRIVRALEDTRHITHTLTMSTRNSERGQTPLPWKGEGGRGSGFDTLDKALVVWQDPTTKGAPHRRVDIIISPWKTVGCAVLGWSGGTTFQRDIRRYCKIEKGLKFDSSGIRDRGSGCWVDVECGDPAAASTKPAADMEMAERRVFDGLGLQWRDPEERCTG